MSSLKYSLSFCTDELIDWLTAKGVDSEDCAKIRKAKFQGISFVMIKEEEHFEELGIFRSARLHLEDLIKEANKVTVEFMDIPGEVVPYCCTDFLGEDEAVALSDPIQKGAFTLKAKIWTREHVLNVHFLNPAVLEQENWTSERSVLNIDQILAWAASWNANKCPNIPKFEKTDIPCEAHIRVKFEGGTCWSMIGSQAMTVQDIFKPTMILSLEGLDPIMQKCLVIHEFGHALGLFHEQQRWLDVNTMKNGIRMKNYDNDMFEKQAQDTTVVMTPEYDPDSIMHYRFAMHWLKKDHKNLSKVGKDQTLVLSSGCLSYVDRPSKKDLDFLQKLYGFSGHPPPQPAAHSCRQSPSGGVVNSVVN